MKPSLLFYRILSIGMLLSLSCGCASTASYYFGGPLSKITTTSSGIIETASGVKKIYQTFPPSVLDRIIITSDLPSSSTQFVPVAELWAKFVDFSDASKDKLAQALQVKAAQLGAEMVVNVQFTIIPIIKIGKASGLAIKLKP